jgi:hypothetical protein
VEWQYALRVGQTPWALALLQSPVLAVPLPVLLLGPSILRSPQLELVFAAARAQVWVALLARGF